MKQPKTTFTTIVPPASKPITASQPVKKLVCGMHLLEIKNLSTGAAGDVVYFPAGTECEFKVGKVCGWTCQLYIINGKVYNQF